MTNPSRPARPSEAPAPTRKGWSRKRILALARLVMLIGGPIFVLFSIFAIGVYAGVANREAVIGFEARWLGLEPLPEPATSETTPAKPEPAEPKPTEPEPGKPKPEPAKPEPAKPEPAKPEPTEPAKPEPTEPAQPKPTEPAQPIVALEPLSGELAVLLAAPRVLGVKVMVDPALLLDQPETWLTYVDALVRTTSEVFERAFGIELELRGVVVWTRTANTGEGLIEDLAARPREGADLILGLAMQPPLGVRPAARDDGVVVAYAEAGRGDRFRLPLLRALAAGFGAASTPDASSWMSESLPEGAPLRIDATNRALVLRNKATYPRTPALGEPDASD